MPDPSLFKNKYRIASTRLPGRNYADPGRYFVTICTQPKTPWFGFIRDGVMHLSWIGRIVEMEWKRTADVRPYVTLDEFVVMPDHMHMIVVINPHETDVVETARRAVSTGVLRPQSIGAIIGQFKSICTKRIWAAGRPDFTWQPRFHDRVIRDGDAMERIRAYIRNNSRNWKSRAPNQSGNRQG